MEFANQRRGQVEIGIIDLHGQVFAAFGSSITGRHITAYTRHQDGQITLTRWDGSTMIACRGEVVREYYDGSLALMFRLIRRRYIVGFVLGDDGMLFCGELVTPCYEEDARQRRSKSPSIGQRSTPRMKPIPGMVIPMTLKATIPIGDLLGRGDLFASP